MIQNDKRLSDIEAALSKLTRRVDRGFTDLGRMVAERHETDEIARLHTEIHLRDQELSRSHAEIHRRDQEIASLRADADAGDQVGTDNDGQMVANSKRSNSIPKIYARTRRKVLGRLFANESARRAISRLPGGMESRLQIAVVTPVEPAPLADVIEPASAADVVEPVPLASAFHFFDPHGSRPSDLAEDGRISIERLCRIAQEVGDAKGARA